MAELDSETCPVCGSDNIDVYLDAGDDNFIHENCGCNDCNSAGGINPLQVNRSGNCYK